MFGDAMNLVLQRILNQFLDWVDMYYDVDEGTHQVTVKAGP